MNTLFTMADATMASLAVVMATNSAALPPAVSDLLRQLLLWLPNLALATMVLTKGGYETAHAVKPELESAAESAQRGATKEMNKFSGNGSAPLRAL